MRRVRYAVAVSLDGFIAGPNGESDWITMDPDPDFDFNDMFREFDTLLVGRRTYEPMATAKRATMPGMRTVVFSRSLRQTDHPDVEIVADGHLERLKELRAESGKDIWLFGGGALFASLAQAKLVDTVEVSVMPVLLGSGVPLAPVPNRIGLRLEGHKVHQSGAVSLEYAIA